MSKKARNEFEVLMRTLGVTKKRFGEITGAKGTTVDKYLANPSLLRVKHLQCLANAEEIGYSKNDLLNKIK
jgi:hypothetical protein